MGEHVAKEMSLYSCQNGIGQVCATTEIDAQGQFSLSAELPGEGFYLLGNEKHVRHALYLKGSEQFNVVFSNDGLKVTDGLSPEGKLASRWEEPVSRARMHAYLFLTVPGGENAEVPAFRKEMEALARLSQELSRQLPSDSRFGRLMRLKMDADKAFLLLSYRHNHIADVEEHFITDSDLRQWNEVFKKEDLLQVPFAPEMLTAFVDYRAELQGLEPEDFKARAGLLEGKPLREVYLCRVANQLRYYEKYAALREAFAGEAFSSAFEQAMRPVEERLAWSKPGIMAPDFKGKCPDGTWLSLSDLRGKVVVIDVWATWCVPCLRMMPYFKQLEKELSHDELTFMSVCVGTEVEVDLWKKLIEQHQLSGNVMFIDSWTKGFAADYRVTGVPRFMIIDREGRIVSVAAPAPKYPKLKEMILKTLGS